MHLLDINVWLALTFQSHVHHASAKTWFEGLADDGTCFFCRMTQLGYLRLSTNPKAFGSEAVTLLKAWENYDKFSSDPRVGYLDEPPGLDPQWRRSTSSATFSPHVWNDAFLASFAYAANCTVVTFDHGFVRYSPVSAIILR